MLVAAASGLRADRVAATVTDPDESSLSEFLCYAHRLLVNSAARRVVADALVALMSTVGVAAAGALDPRHESDR
jgi:hypothetical protein